MGGRRRTEALHVGGSGRGELLWVNCRIIRFQRLDMIVDVRGLLITVGT